MTQKIARMNKTGVAWIFDPAKTLGTCIFFQLVPPTAQQRPDQAPGTKLAVSRHTRQTVYTCATEQPEQQRFGLIVQMLPGEQHAARRNPITQRSIAGLARSALEAWTRFIYLYAKQFKRETKLLADLAAMRRPIICHILQPVMNMDSDDRW